MFLLYNQVTQSIANNLAGYNVGAWNFFFNEVANELSSLVTYCNEGEKNVSILKSNLPYIKNNISNVNGVGKDDKRTHFTYYDPIEGGYDNRRGPAILADPSNDTKEDLTGSFRPHLDNGVGYVNVDGIPVHSVYDEESSVGMKLVPSDGFSDYTAVETLRETDKNSLLSKTNRWFKKIEGDYIQDRFKTIHSRFHTADNLQEDLESDISNSAFSKQYGLSHGRNLLKVVPDSSYGYDNPYCRVWTYHHQYHRIVSDTMRPFLNNSGEPATLQDLNRENGWGAFRAPSEGGFEDGATRLGRYGAMYDNGGKTNGFVNITPSYDVLHTEGFSDRANVDLRHCMFSIENLAWKGMFSDYDDGMEFRGLSREQKGPLGGRIMWFPPYDLSFNESSSARWEENNFIGRGEPMYTYSNTSRSGTLTFKLLIDHPAILDYWSRKNEVGNPYQSSVDDIDSKEQEMLRFFAGCTRLSTKKVTPIEDAPTPQPKPDPNPEPKPEPVKRTVDNIIQFFVFYPNNYSGMDDKVNGEVDPIEYLLNGVATQQYYPKISKDKVLATKTTHQSTIPLSMKTFWGRDSKRLGGYEVRDAGISSTDKSDTSNTIGWIYAYDNASQVGTSAGTMYMAAKLIGSEAITDSKSKDYYKKRYYYRADKNTLNQVLLGKEDSYIDKASFKLNSTGYQSAVSHFKLKDKDKTFSLAEMYVAIKGDEAKVLDGLYNQEHVALIKSVLAGEKGKVTKVVCKGMASSQSNSDRSNKNQNNLARNRAITIQNWLKANLKGEGIEYSQENFKVSEEQTNSKWDVNEKVAKMTRMAFVEIHYNKETTEDASESQIAVDENRKIENGSTVVTNMPQGSTEDTDMTTTNLNEIVVKTRYDNEARFFKKLQENDPFITKLLSERVRYFNPAFHSMSPEGFNARLTFLNQCLRQGPTVSAADTKNTNANNLAFGRPPVCVLRIGDFYNTKIIITSLNIEYDPLLWDLNQEGIGVMPMIANVSLQFNFIGGSDLGGPIQRLQNAISFNYYANASVYDNRAENIEYEHDTLGTVKAFKAYGPELF